MRASKLTARLKATGAIITSRPHVILLPLALTALIMGLGIWAVIAGAANETNSARTRATAHVEAAASTMQLSIQAAILPAVQLADWVLHTRNYSAIDAQFLERAPDWFKQAPKASFNLALTTNGTISHAFPWTPALGIDILADPGSRDQVLQDIQYGNALASDPYLDPFTYDDPKENGDYLMNVVVPIMIPNVSESETWGIPYNATNCPPGNCYNATTRTRWWGSAVVTLNASAFIAPEGDNPLASLKQAGHQIQAFRPPNPLMNDTERVVVSRSGIARPQPADAIRGVVPVAQTQWEVYIWFDSWEPSWKNPLIAVVVVASVICGCLVFAILLSWAENRLLLHSILPEATIERMKTDMEWKTLQASDTLRLVEIETPAQHMQAIIQAILAGQPPCMAMVVAVQQALKRSADVYRPANKDVASKINAGNLDVEVQRALVQQLALRQGTSSLRDTEETETDQPLASTVDVVMASRNTHDGRLSSSHAIRSSGQSFTPAGKPSGKLTTNGRPMELHTALVGGCSVTTPGHVQSANIPSDDDGVEGIPALGSRCVSKAGHTDEGSLLAIKLVAGPEKPIMEQLDRVLNSANTWVFNAFELEEATQGHPLSVLGYWLIHNSGCMEYARMDGAVLARFLRSVEEGYKTNPYHNSRHAADVLQTFHVILHQGGLMPGYCDQLTLLGCYLAAIMHDYEHRGCSNDFLVNTHDELAVRYNDRSPMENHHLAAAWGLMQQPGLNCLSGLTKGNWDKLRKLVIDLVLATDMRQHFAIMGQFSLVHCTKEGSAVQMAARLTGNSGGSSQDLGKISNQVLVPSGDQDKLLSLQVALKCSDVGHLAAPLPVHLRWVAALEEEFFLQGDAERARGMALSPLCDRTKEGVTKSQVGFFDFVVLPLYSHFTQKFTASKPLLHAVVCNYRHWQAKEARSSVEVAKGN